MLGAQVFSLSHAHDMLINSFSHNFFFFSEGKFKSFGLSNYTAWQVVSVYFNTCVYFNACEMEGNYFP